MMIIMGGAYNNKEYTCMCDAGYKRAEQSRNKKHYFHVGYQEDEDRKLALLAFDMNTDKLSFATLIPDGAIAWGNEEQEMEDLSQFILEVEYDNPQMFVD